MRRQLSHSMICSADLDAAAVLLQQVCEEEVRFPRSPVTPEQVTLNLDHAHRVRASAAAIALGEGLNVNLLELASILHDVCKLDHREVSSGGIDTWHHHHRGASLARKLLLVDLNLDVQVAEIIARMIESHSDIPFIRRYWETAYHSSPPTPATIEEFALRDADAMDLIWIGGMSKIIHIRQVPAPPFMRKTQATSRGQ